MITHSGRAGRLAWALGLMIFFPPIALPHLESAVIEELRRLERVSEEVGDDWPEGFDPNDIPLFLIVLKALREKGCVSGKPKRFLLLLLPQYVEKRMADLSDEEYRALSCVYEQQEEFYRIQFPHRA